jgi:betaine-aldehyde dehydrogenase
VDVARVGRHPGRRQPERRDGRGSGRRRRRRRRPAGDRRRSPRVRRGDWPRSPVGERVALLHRTADLLERDRDKVARAETLNTGKALRESCWDVDDVIKVFRYYAGLVDKETGRLVATPGRDAVAKIVYEPIGVCGLIGPWNYPLLQISWKVAPALAAGDTIVMKPASYTPLTTILLTELLEEAGAPKGVVNLVLGPGDRVGEALAASPDVDMVSLTGGIEAGRRLVLASAGNLKRVALELGGKSPTSSSPTQTSRRPSTTR